MLRALPPGQGWFSIRVLFNQHISISTRIQKKIMLTKIDFNCSENWYMLSACGRTRFPCLENSVFLSLTRYNCWHGLPCPWFIDTLLTRYQIIRWDTLHRRTARKTASVSWQKFAVGMYAYVSSFPQIHFDVLLVVRVSKHRPPKYRNACLTFRIQARCSTHKDQCAFHHGRSSALTRS